ncbi:MAG: UDP-N-acetylmuramoyl-L-alanine--D-glutamate ligase [Candidatus Omnitrophota bacterium]
MDLRNKRVTVVGLGNSGINSALLLEKQGAIVSATDSGWNETVKENAKLLESRFVDLEIGRHTESFLNETELIVVSPGVEKSALPLRYAEKNNIPVISELELGYNYCEGRIVAVTGTNGKSTVVSLIGEILRQADRHVNVCGNIGNAFTGEIENIKKETIVVLEISSFQLEDIVSFRPMISVILNIAEDHLDRYKEFDEYICAKKRIFLNQKKGDVTVLNYDDEHLKRLPLSGKFLPKVHYFSCSGKVKSGIYVDGNTIMTSLGGKDRQLFKIGDYSLKGRHNRENVLAAALVATLLGVDSRTIENAVRNFTPLAHRFQLIGTVSGIEFIDDSKATNIHSTDRALRSVEKPAILIAGGKDKGLTYESIVPVVKEKVKMMVLIGETKKRMSDIFKNIVPVEEKATLEEATRAAYKSASKGDCVLLSPMCSSFDMFRNYKHRGEVFCGAVRELEADGSVHDKNSRRNTRSHTR